MTDQLRQAAQQALEALERYQVKRQDFDRFADEITALRTALEQQAEPVSHAAIAGALFDFMGWLTTRKERLVLSSVDNASPAADAIKAFAEMRGLSLDDARVQDWNTSLPQQQAEPICPECKAAVLYECVACSSNNYPPKQQAEPVAWDVFELRLYGAPQEKQHRVLWVDRYTYPDGSTPDLDTLLEAAKTEGGIDGRAKTLHVRPLYTTPPQRQWVGLTDKDFLEACQIAERGNYLVALQRIQIKLKERNNV